MFWQKKSIVAKGIEIEDKYKQHHVLPKLEDASAQRRLNYMVAGIFAITFGVISWLFLYHVADIFHQGFLLFLVGLTLFLGITGLSAWFGHWVAMRAGKMRVEQYYQLYAHYEGDLQEVKVAREALMRAEERLASTEDQLDRLIGSTYNRPLLVASFAAISAVFLHKWQKSTKHLARNPEKTTLQAQDLTDQMVYQHDIESDKGEPT
ncbi:hypothetical protein [Entomospira culicis]|uniref:Uncharacterized protein n=1 Tax=Entomospira culicis TaxID=2719989 RepID=A0A968GIB1_9SPIO|nr:hypothetical protein [Entomospira culicis]NIZ19601.1 hypothetical protein [Entomospira culicis]NIZ69494.1 hypothetical protein [Entomospira culicis]WDI36609.1 hypothetical protein PVA46_04600 [Entomospira culicis]WDI38237.1 hypothetical protein PVA47_04610 [Entomospira culicis]